MHPIPRARRMRQRSGIRAAVLAPTALIVVLSAWPVVDARAQMKGGRSATDLESTVDATIKPGDDFFAYANGAWLHATRIPAGKERWGVRDEINDATRAQLARLMEDTRAA